MVSETVHRHTRTVLVLIAALAIGLLLAGCGEPEDPSRPTDEEAFTLLGQASTWVIPYDLAFEGDSAYVAQDLAGVMRFDVSNPAAPVLVDTMEATDAEVLEEVRHVRPLISQWGRIILGSNDGDPVDMYEYPEMVSMNYIAQTGIQRDLFVYTYTDSVISDFDQQLHEAEVIQIVGADRDDGVSKYVWHEDSVAAGDTVIYYGRYNTGLRVAGLKFNGFAALGLSKMPDPEVVAAGLGPWGVGIADLRNEGGVEGQWFGIVDTPGEAGSGAYANGYLYVADGEKGFAIIDVSDYENPRYVDSWQVEGMEHADIATARGHRLVVADQFDGLYFLDITNPEAPELMGHTVVRNARAIVFRTDTIIGVVADYEGFMMYELDY